MNAPGFHLRDTVHLQCGLSAVAQNRKPFVVPFLRVLAPRPIFALESHHAQPPTQFRAGAFDAQSEIGETVKVSGGLNGHCRPKDV
jgi:hypothetical protein